MKPQTVEIGGKTLTTYHGAEDGSIFRPYRMANWREALILVDLCQNLGARLRRFPRIELSGTRVTVRLPPEGEAELVADDLALALVVDEESELPPAVDVVPGREGGTGR